LELTNHILHITGFLALLLVWESTMHLPSHDCHYPMLRSFFKMDVSNWW